MKKKIVSLMSALVLAVTGTMALASCSSSGSNSAGSADSAAGVVGTWKLSGAEAAGQKLDASMLGSFDYSFTFKDDGVAGVTVMGQTNDAAKYTFENDTVTFSDASLAAVKLKLDGGKLVFEEPTSGTKLFFEKQ